VSLREVKYAVSFDATVYFAAPSRAATCVGADSIGETIAKAFEQAQFALMRAGNDDARVKVEISRCCRTCRGAGKVHNRSRRANYAVKLCTCCKGDGVPVEVTSFMVGTQCNVRIVERES
jgi:DnaJ-class molecular chaperone